MVRELVFEVGVFEPISVDFVVFLVAYRVVLSNFLLMLIVVRDVPVKLAAVVS